MTLSINLTILLYFLILFLDKEVSVADASLMTKVLRTHLTNVKSEVEVLQKDPNSPLYSAKTFEELRLYVFISFKNIDRCIGCKYYPHCFCIDQHKTREEIRLYQYV